MFLYKELVVVEDASVLLGMDDGLGDDMPVSIVPEAIEGMRRIFERFRDGVEPVIFRLSIDDGGVPVRLARKEDVW